MKIAVAALTEKEDSEISQQAGRAPFYLIFDDGKLSEVLKNPFRRGGGGAGFGVAKMLKDKGVEFVIAGRFGPNMETSMQSYGMKFQEKAGSVREAIKAITS